MQPSPGGFRNLRSHSSVTRALFTTAFVLDVIGLLIFQQRRAFFALDGPAVQMPPLDPSTPELILVVGSMFALVLTLRRMAVNARVCAPGTSPLWTLGPRLLRPWNRAGLEALDELWRLSAPPEVAAPPATIKLLWSLWSCWLPLFVTFAVYEAVFHPRWGLAASVAALIAALHAALSVCAVLAIGELAGHQDRRTSLGTALPWGRMTALAEPSPVALPAAGAESRPAPSIRLAAAVASDASLCPSCHRELDGDRCGDCGAAARAGDYRIEKVLGSASDRRTYLAHGRDGRPVTLKEVALATVPDAYTLDAFEREAQLLRSLRHSRIPPFVDAFRVGEGKALRFYLAHRFVQGLSLEEEIGQRFYTEPEALDVLEQVLRVVVYLQSLSPPVFHRDIKPSNLIRRSDGTLVLVDFGAARERQGTLRSATMVGSVGYMPPEQLAGQVDRTSDPYAAGATALQMLTRRQPWEFMDGPTMRLPDLPISRGAQKLIARLLAPHKEKRFANAADALRAVERVRERRGARVPA